MARHWRNRPLYSVGLILVSISCAVLAETEPEYQWTVIVYGCIRGNNVGTPAYVGTIRECQQRCVDESSSLCLSIDYRVSDGECLMNGVSSDSVVPPSDYTEPCFVKPFEYQYQERLDVRDFRDGTLRLVGGATAEEGRVEVYIDGAWGTVCDDGWTIEEADVVCHQLGFGPAADALPRAHFGRGTGDILMDDVRCTGREEVLLNCQFSATSDCSHSEDAGVVCTQVSDGDMRLVNGTNQHEGRLEIHLGGQWRVVCDNGWTVENTAVTCSQMGLGDGLEYLSSGHYGTGYKPVLMGDISCSGEEESLSDCSYTEDDNCNRNDAVGIRCNVPATGSVRLLGGQGPHEGRVEVFIDGDWGAVCDNGWELLAANVVCRQLGYPGALTAINGPTFGKAQDPTQMDGVICTGGEVNLLECSYTARDKLSCSHDSSAGVICQIYEQGEIRLVGHNNTAGRVEVFLDGRWGTVCDDLWDKADADVVCRQLGFRESIAAHTNAWFGAGVDPIHLDDVECLGDEVSIMECPHSPVDNCGHYEDAGVTCMETPVETTASTTCEAITIPLCQNMSYSMMVLPNSFGHVSQAEAGLEIHQFYPLVEIECSPYLRDFLCAVYVPDCDSSVPCKELCEAAQSGCSTIMTAYGFSLDESLDCDAFPSSSDGDCFMGNVEQGAIRLVGPNSTAGRVEVFLDGQWGTVCDDLWDKADADVVCRQLGFRESIAAHTNAWFGAGVDPIHLDDVECLGDEVSIMECPHSPVDNCGHSEDAGVTCMETPDASVIRPVNGNETAGRVEVFLDGLWGTVCDDLWDTSTIRLVNGNDTAGRVEVFLDGLWGTVCDDLWGIEDANVACRQLGFPNALSAHGNAFFGEGVEPILMDNVECSGEEESLFDCSYYGSLSENCVHTEDAGVVCFPGKEEQDATCFREDYQCGGDWLAPNGEVAECDPNGIYPCCSPYNWCGITADHCGCEDCIDYRTVETTISTTCEAITIPLCQNMTYSMTVLPNTFGHVSQAEAGLEVHQFYPLLEIECSPYLRDFLCALYVPDCDSSVPCNELCEVVQGGCNAVMTAYGFSWDESLDCDAFPFFSDGGCYMGNLGDASCEETVFSECSHMPYDITQFPNFLGQQTQAEVEADFGYIFTVMRQLGCPAEFFQYMCALAVPPCESTGIPRTPCKELCVAGVIPCYELARSRGLDLPLDEIDCELLPSSSSGSCFEGAGALDPGDGITDTCEKITINDCSVMPYDEAQFPNSLGQQSQVEVEESFGYVFTAMSELGCPLEFFQYMCLVFVPPCESASIPIFPCKELCLAGLRGCHEIAISQDLDIPFDEFSCAALPIADSGTCFNGTSSPSSGEVRTIRLVGGDDNSGTVEVFYLDDWNTICDVDWDMTDATIACRELGFVGAISVKKGAFYGEGDSPNIIDYLLCHGGESSVLNCERVLSGECVHSQDAGVVCSSGDGSNSPWVRNDGRCGGDWLAPNGKVAECDPDGDFPCCSSSNWCENRDSGCDCSSCIDYRLGYGAVRLVGGPNDTAGTVEVYMREFSGPDSAQPRWGTVCDDGWDIADADVVCRYLGYPGARSAPGGALFGNRYGVPIISNVDCSGPDNNIARCSSGPPTCQRVDVAGVVCFPPVREGGGRIRLVDGNDHSGRVEVFDRGSWGTVCDRSWDMTDGGVACRELGFDGAISVQGGAYYGEGSGPINIDYVRCSDYKSSLTLCDRSYGGSSCDHSRDAGVVCEGGGDIDTCEVIAINDCKRMPYDETQFPNQIGQQSQAEVEETFGYLWTAMRELGCPVEFFQYTCALFVPPCESSPIPRIPCKELCLAGVGGCSDIARNQGFDLPLNESSCAALPPTISGTCIGRTNSPPVAGDLRLVDGGARNRGRLEVYLNGEWGTVCRSEFDFSPDGDVVCRQLGFNGISALWYSGAPGHYSQPIHVGDVDCDGSEQRLFQCGYSNSPSCSHSQDVTLDCD